MSCTFILSVAFPVPEEEVQVNQFTSCVSFSFLLVTVQAKVCGDVSIVTATGVFPDGSNWVRPNAHVIDKVAGIWTRFSAINALKDCMGVGDPPISNQGPICTDDAVIDPV